MTQPGGDTVSATIEDADAVTVGKNNVQQVVNVQANERDGDGEHVLTVRLLNQAMLHHFGEMKHEFKAELDALRAEVSAAIAAQDARRQADLEVLRQESDATMVRAMDGAVMLPEKHDTIFNLAFVALYAPVPLFYSQVRELIGVSWGAALGIATVAYITSSYLWRHMWSGGRRAR